MNATTSARARLARLFANAPAPCRAYLRWALADAGRAKYVGLPALAAQLTPLDAPRTGPEQREAEALLGAALPWLARG
jgi:hypothetical protein